MTTNQTILTKEELKEIRLNLGMNVSMLGRAMGCTRNKIFGLESGRMKITEETARHFKLLYEMILINPSSVNINKDVKEKLEERRIKHIVDEELANEPGI